MKIEIETIPHHLHRYPTVGDYFDDENGVKQIRVSELGDWRMEVLVALHELIEVSLCDQRGISEADITAFDEANLDAPEPGNLPEAPYHSEHVFADGIERLVARELGVEWAEYEDAIGALFPCV